MGAKMRSKSYEKEIHLFIIWENGRNKEKEILGKIEEDFRILNMFEIKWTEEKIAENFSRFYELIYQKIVIKKFIVVLAPF